MSAPGLDASPAVPALDLFRLDGEVALVTGGSRGEPPSSPAH